MSGRRARDRRRDNPAPPPDDLDLLELLTRRDPVLAQQVIDSTDLLVALGQPFDTALAVTLAHATGRLRLLHGGVPGLRVGAELLPPTKTGGNATVMTVKHRPRPGRYRGDRVYLTDDVRLAELYAEVWPGEGGGTVYEVEPVGALGFDADWPLDAASVVWTAPSARVTKVVSSGHDIGQTSHLEQQAKGAVMAGLLPSSLLSAG